MKRVFFILSFLLSIIACTNNTDLIEEIQEEVNTSQPRNAISIEDALKLLSAYEDVPAKSSNKQIENIVYIPNPNYDAGTKSNNTQNEDNPYLLYVVNYEDDGGYVVLSADKRLPTDIYAITESGNIDETDIYGQDEEDYPISLLYQSARGHIPGTDTTTTDPTLPDPGEPFDPNPPIDLETGEWIVTTWGPWRAYESVPTMLPTKWHQNSPFNDNVQPLLAGCTSIALLQVLAYNAYPTDHFINQFHIPYHLLKYQEEILPGTPYAQSVALFVEQFHNMRQDYHISGNSTLIFPDQARDHMEWLGYENVVLHRYGSDCDMSTIFSSLDNNYPILISAMAEQLTSGGHSWVIDGYRKERRYGAKYGEETGDYYGQDMEERFLVHCNWGWINGDHNGYFYAGIFDPNQPVVPDPSQQNNNPNLYNRFYRVITYRVPGY